MYDSHPNILRFSTVFLSLFISLFAAAQEQAYNWYFGFNAGLDFSAGTPVQVFDGQNYTFEGCASYSDAQGNLLFYTNGGGRDPILSGQSSGKIWNRNHEVMYDMGNTQGGGFSATQSSLVLPKPGQDSVYYLFTMEEVEYNVGGPVVGQPQGRGLSYFEIDMRLNAGLGGVSVPDQRLYVPAYEGLSATAHDNDRDFWVLAYQFDQNINQFIILPVSPAPLDPLDIRLHLVGFDYPLQGAIKISPDGRWVTCNGYFFNFDNATGQISGPVFELPAQNTGSFTHDSRYYYYSRTINNQTRIHRIDMDAADIPASEEELATAPSLTLMGSPFQIGPNKNIYFAHSPLAADQLVGEIQCPSSSEPTVIFDRFSFEETVSGQTFLGLPNFADHIFAAPLPDTIDLPNEPLVLCAGDTLLLESRIAGIAYQWTTGDTTAAIVVTTPGFYGVTVTDAFCREFFDRRLIQAGPARPTVSIAPLPADLPCEGGSLVLSATATNATDPLQWSNGQTGNSITVSTSGTYLVTATNACTSATDSVVVTLPDMPPSLALSGPSEAIPCMGTAQLLAESDAPSGSLQWSTGAVGNSITATATGTFTVTATNACGSNSQSIDIFIPNELPEVDILQPEGPFCEGDAVVLKAQSNLPAESLSWTTGQSGDEIQVLNSGFYEIIASNACGSASDTITITFEPCLPCEVHIPNVITPNNDRINDGFKAYTNCTLLEYQLQVYSRWGQKVFASTNPGETWLGEYNGHPAPADLYIYQLQYRFEEGEAVTVKGNLTLMR